MDNDRVDYLLDKWTSICTYSPPDDDRVQEHKQINNTILASMHILPNTPNTPEGVGNEAYTFTDYLHEYDNYSVN